MENIPLDLETFFDETYHHVEQKLDDKRGIAILKVLIGYVNYKALNYDKALENFRIFKG